VPFFKSIVLISFVCDFCGYKNSEVKTGGEVSKKGLNMSVKVLNSEDLNRDFFKSDTAVVRIPEVGLELASGCMGSFYSTIEGFLDKVID
jgi:zinc finger protein